MHDDSEAGGPELLVDQSFDPTTTDPVDALLRALGETGRVDLTTAEPLASAVDPDALDAIFGRNADNVGVQVCFRYEGLEVVLSGDGEIRVAGGSADDRTDGGGVGLDNQGHAQD